MLGAFKTLNEVIEYKNWFFLTKFMKNKSKNVV